LLDTRTADSNGRLEPWDFGEFYVGRAELSGGFVEPAVETEIARWWPKIPWQTADEHPVVSSGLALGEDTGGGRTRFAGPAFGWPKD
jgi:hypothetical protein